MRGSRSKCVVALLVAGWLGVAASAAAGQAAVFVVDDQPGPGVDFTSLEPAFAAAAEHDTILVKAGVYEAPNDFTQLVGKSLAITADAGATVTVKGCFIVRDLTANQFVSVAGIKFDGANGVEGFPAVSLQDNAGAVWFERCKMSGGAQSSLFSGSNGAEIGACTDVTLVACEAYGGPSMGYGKGLAGLVSTDSQVFVFDTTVAGGSNGCSSSAFLCPSSSAPGVLVHGGKLLLEGSSIRAGSGGMFCDPFCPFPQQFCCAFGGQGSGLVLFTGAPHAYQFDTEVLGGNPPISVQSGVLTDLPGTSRDLTVTSPVREGQTITLDFAGETGDTAYVFLAYKAIGLMAPQFSGALLAASPNALLLIGPLSAAGTLSLQATVPAFDPGLNTVAFVLQSAFLTAGGGIILSDPARVVMLSSAY